MPQSRQHGKLGSSLRPPLRDRIHSGATVPSPQGTGRFPASAPPRQDPQRCHGPVTAGNRALPSVSPSATGPTAVPRSRHRREAALWRRSPQRLAQVPGHPGAGPKKWWSPAPRNCFQCFPVAQDSKRKTDLLRLAGGPAPPAEGTCATGRGDLRRKKGGPAPPGEGTCAIGRRHLRRRERGPAPQGADLMRTKEES